MANLIRRLRYWWSQREHDAALRDEIAFHQAMKQGEYEAAGMPARDAQFAARRELGNVTRAREDSRAVWLWPWLESVGQDTTYAVRSLLRQPGFTLLSVLVLGLAIGLNTSLFTVFAGLALRPMAGLADSSRVVSVSMIYTGGRGGRIGMSFPEFTFLADENRSFSGLVAERDTSVTAEADGIGRTTTAHAVTGNYFDVLGVRLEHGRGFLPEEDRRGSSEHVVILSHTLWDGVFGSNPAIVGTAIRINDMPHTVVGIAAREFTGSEGGVRRLWLPLSSLPALLPRDSFDATLLDRAQDCCVEVMGRLGDGISRDQAQAELQVLSDRFRAGVGQEPRPLVLGGTQFLRGRAVRSPAVAVMGVLFLGIVLVLLIACANVGNLLLARAAARADEIGVRLSLGAGRSRIVRQLLTEGLVLALVASLVGVAVATWLPPLVLNDLAGQPAPFDISPDGWVLGYALLLAAIACLAFALAPALHATRSDVAVVLKPGALPQRFPLRSVLLGLQVAVTVVLLTSAGLLLRGVSKARGIDPGFTTEGVVVGTIELPQPAYDASRAQTFLADLTAGLEAAGVEAFSLVSNEPLGDASSMTAARLPGEGDEHWRTIEFLDVTPGYFDVLGISIAAGRGFVEADAGRDVAIVNESMARRYWPDDNPIGRSFFAGGARRSLEVIGVVGDANIDKLDVVEPMFFQPMTNVRGDRFPKLLFESRQPSTTAAVTAVIQRLEQRARVDATPLRDRLERRFAELHLAPLAASVLGLFGLLLATVGMFGVFGYVVRQRTREIGVRMALGARHADIIRVVLVGSSRAVVSGLAAGILGALAASQVLRSSLYGLSPLDPVTFGGVAVMLSAAAFAASYVPARRAARIDPVRALRCD